MPGKNNKKAFSLLEMLVVVGILALLASASVPVTELAFNNAKEEELQDALDSMREAIGLWRRDCRNAIVAQSKYGYDILDKVPYEKLCPPSLEALVECGPITINIPIPKAGGIIETEVATFSPHKYLDRIPIDPFVGRACWLLHLASGSADYGVYGLHGNVTKGFTKEGIEAGSSYEEPIPPVFINGIFDVSCVASNTVDSDDYYTRRGFNVSVDGTLYEDW